MKSRLLKRNLKLFASVLFIAFSMNLVNGQTSATAFWALTSNGNTSITGSISAPALVLGSTLSSPTYNATYGVSAIGWSNDAASLQDNEYHEFNLTPNAGNTLTLTSLSGEHSVNTGNWQVGVFYSMDNFITSTSLLSFAVSSSVSVGSSFPLNIKVPAGATLSLRIFAWESDGVARSYRNRNIKMTGVTCPEMSISTQPTNQSVCIGSTLTLSSLYTNATSYQWYKGVTAISGATSATYTKSGVVASNAGNYYVIAKNGCGDELKSDVVTVEVNPTSVGGTIAGATTVCAGTTSGVLILSGHTGTIVRWESAVSPFSTWTPITNTLSTYTSGAITQTIKFRAVVQSGACAAVTSSVITIGNSATTWNGSIWNNGAPTSTTAAIIGADYTASSTINACSLTVTNNANVIVSGGKSVVLHDVLTVDSGSTFTLENNANLLQGGTSNLNSGAIKVKRFSSALKRQDYTLWSSPTTGSQKLLNFSPATLTNRFYSHDTATDLLVAISSPSTTAFSVANGYLIRMPNTHPATATVWESGAFVGIPNNGDYTMTMVDAGVGKRFNLVGNPYPSPINAVDFVEDVTNAANTTGSLYFWRKTNNSSNPSYCMWTKAGFTSNGEAQVFDPENVIQIGQGFFVEASGTGTSLNFNNTMRIDNHANQFFKTTVTTERHRIWLNATNADGLFSQTLIGYMSNATDSLDAADGKYINDGAIALTSILNESSYAILKVEVCHLKQMMWCQCSSKQLLLERMQLRLTM